MAIKDLYPSIHPTLDLNFAGTRTVDPRITFTRASTATYFDEFGVMRTVPANTPRIDFDPVTRECKGLLIEEQRTNLLKYSEQFDNVVWGITSATVTPNNIVAPDGAQTADRLVETSGTGVLPLFSLEQTVVSATVYTISIYAKEVSGSTKRYLQVYANSGFTQVAEGGSQGANFDLGSGTVTFTNGFSASITAAGNGWYRCTVITSTSNATIAGFRIAMQDSPIAQMASSWNPTGTGSIALWGAQLEVGTFQTSYIKTESSPVPRAADSAVMTGSNFSGWYNQSEGTLFADYILGADNSSCGLFHIGDGSSSNTISMRYSSGAQAQYSVTTNGVMQSNLAPFGYSTPGKYKRAANYVNNSFQQAINGVLPSGVDTIGVVPFVNTLYIGAESAGGSNSLNGHIARLAYYQKALSSANLQAITT